MQGSGNFPVWESLPITTSQLSSSCDFKFFRACALSQISNHTSPQGDVCTNNNYNCNDEKDDLVTSYIFYASVFQKVAFPDWLISVNKYHNNKKQYWTHRSLAITVRSESAAYSTKEHECLQWLEIFVFVPFFSSNGRNLNLEWGWGMRVGNV